MTNSNSQLFFNLLSQIFIKKNLSKFEKLRNSI